MLKTSIRNQLFVRELRRLAIFVVLAVVTAPQAIPALKLFYSYVKGGFNG
jgi:hypothetical protein